MLCCGASIRSPIPRLTHRKGAHGDSFRQGATNGSASRLSSDSLAIANSPYTYVAHWSQHVQSALIWFISMPIITPGLKSVIGLAPVIGGNSVTSISNTCRAIVSGAVLVMLAWPVFADDRSTLERQVDRISHKELDLPWLHGDANIWSGAASAVLAGIAVDRASIDSPHGGLIVDTDI